MEVIYISTVVSKSKLDYIINNSKKKPLQSIQKFHRLLCEGFAKNKIKVKTLSSIPMSKEISSKLVWIDKKEIENGVEYTYIPFLNVKILRQISTGIGILLKVIKECFKNKKDKVFICDILNTTIASITVVLSKIFRFKCIAIVTDLPRDIGKGMSTKINQKIQTKYDGYILLTEAMNNVVNLKNKPSIVIEGIADIEMENTKNILENKAKEKICIYAGGLYEKYGVKNLIEAFKKLNIKNSKLHLYGTGDLEEELKNLNNDKIKYFGVVTNQEIVEEEIKATLLINPRFSKEEYTKYSFPSKNMEYMVSGTPILTTKLQGMPKEYYDYIYCFKDESVEGMKKKIEEVLSLEIEELNNKGKKAKEFVLKNKNNIVQSKKIINLCKKILEDKNEGKTSDSYRKDE